MYTRWQILPVLLLVLVAGCAARQPDAPPPASMTVTAGEEFDIRLPANPTTGFRWQVGSLDENIVRLVDSRYERTAPDPLGAGGTTVFTFVGVEKGRGNISLVYVRPWEKGVAPARTADYSVDVL